MKVIYRIFILLLFATTANAAYIQITNTSGTATYGGLSVTVVPTGSFTTWSSWCTMSFGTSYWIGSSGPGNYTYTLSRPVHSIKVVSYALNGGAYMGGGEYLQMYLNGAPYSLTTTDMTSYTDCPGAGSGPCYLASGWLWGPVGSGSDYDGGDFTINQCTNINSFEMYCNGTEAGVTYYVWVDTTLSCFSAINNGPLCLGDTLRLSVVGGDTTMPYTWFGPHGYTTTGRYPIIPNIAAIDSGTYFVVQTIGGVSDTAWTHVIIKPNPVLTASSNSPVCVLGVLDLFAGPDSTGETFSWTGPSLFSSTLENPVITSFAVGDTGLYTVIANWNGCKDTASTYVSLAQVPNAPYLYGQTIYCSCDAFVPILDSGLVPGAHLLWYPSAIGGASSTLAPLLNTCIPGTYHFYASQIVGSCEGPRDSITIIVHHTPAAPIVTYNAEYCQYDPFIPVIATSAGTGVIYWYTAPVGGSPSTTAPTISTATANTYTFYASQIDSGCESPRTAFTITVHPKPAAPTVTPPTYCQFDIPSSLVTSISGVLPGAAVTWYIGTSSTGLSIAPTPSTALPSIDSYYVKQTSVYGCKSDSVLDIVTIHPQPVAPVTTDTSYCQESTAFPLSVDAVAIDGNTLTWYTSLYGAGATTTAPVPPTTVVGTTTWYVSQTNSFGCISPKSPITVTTLYLPVFTISQSKTFACQDSTMTLTYTGANLTQGAYTWIIPAGATLVNGSTLTSPSITVQFDSLYNNIVYLTSSDYNGRCVTSDTIDIHVVPMPVARTFITPVVCVGDTVGLALSYRSENGYSFVWDFAFGTSGTDGQIIAANSNSGGPYSASWNSGGVKVVTVTPYTMEGCKGILVYDSVHVRDLPDATYGWLTNNQSLGSNNELCSDDTVQFVAHTDSANFAYTWEPAHFFRENNGHIIFGIVQISGDITLNVVDPYGCKNSVSSYFKVDGCCTVTMPNAFTPNGDGKNDYFRPVYEGYHRFHIFRVENRWGQTVFESTNNRMEWDGTFGGVPQDIGVYYYYLQYDCGDQKGIIKRGDFTLIR